MLIAITRRVSPAMDRCELAYLPREPIVVADRKVFAGASQRTNAAGIAQLSAALVPFGYSVQPVAVHGCLHLKSACCYLGAGAFLVNRAWIDIEPLRGYRLIDVAEPWAA